MRTWTRPSAAQSRRVAILGTDTALESVLRESVADVNFVGAHTLTALADLIVLRPCDALVVDVAALDVAPLTAFTKLAAQFPRLPIVAIGSRSDEAALAGLISGGQVYRFLHRPLSPARTRVLLGAALRRHAASPVLPAPASVRPAARGTAGPMSPAAILACGIGLALLAVVAWWLLAVTSR